MTKLLDNINNHDYDNLLKLRATFLEKEFLNSQKMTKGEIMNKVFTVKELVNVDTAIPREYWASHDAHDHVMNYNNSTFGELTSLKQLAKERNIDLDG